MCPQPDVRDATSLNPLLRGHPVKYLQLHDPMQDVAENRVKRQALHLAQYSCAWVAIKTVEGVHAIGTAFHVGNGVYLTARHVLEGNTIEEIGLLSGGRLFLEDLQVPVPTKGTLVTEAGEFPVWSLRHEKPAIADGPFYHPNPEIDVAAFTLSGIDQNTPYFQIGGHYDDWINDDDWLLTGGTAFGFPPIPFTHRPVLVVATVEVNAVIDTRLDRYVRFVVSGEPRGGFSGGPVLHEWGFVLGMIIQSLEHGAAQREGGFFTVLSIEPLRECLEEYGLLPDFQRID